MLIVRFDSSVGRGDFVVQIGVGQVIKGKFKPANLVTYSYFLLIFHYLGWDEGVLTMKTGEKATLDISRFVIPQVSAPWAFLANDMVATSATARGKLKFSRKSFTLGP